ncbi:hypothetical protein [Bacillus phage vB_BanS-Thrax3]|nr:hypothetical protein [Bacillus phage vB_BanS-Thrax3]
MKLFELYINNGSEYCEELLEDRKLVVLKDEEEANREAEKWLNEEYIGRYEGDLPPYFKVQEISEVDGYKITVG